MNNKHLINDELALFAKLRLKIRINDIDSLKLNYNFKCRKHEEIEETYIVDRFEGNYAICENRRTKEMTNIKTEELPEYIAEGDVIVYQHNEYKVDYEKRKETEERIQNKLKNIFND